VKDAILESMPIRLAIDFNLYALKGVKLFKSKKGKIYKLHFLKIVE
jgi:hypothetical protein